MGALWRSLFGKDTPEVSGVAEVQRLRAGYDRLTDEELKLAGRMTRTLPEVVAVTAAVAARVLGLSMFDVQVQGALALADGRIVEMQTGEGKTLAAVPAIVWHARTGGGGVHVLTANDYLAQRDAQWMGEVYAWMGLSVGVIHQGLLPSERHAAYRRDVTYASAQEVGFDYLRDGLARGPEDQVHRPFAAAVIDEADSLLIDEARIPLVIAGGLQAPEATAAIADRVVRELVPNRHFTIDRRARQVALTAAGVSHVERAFGCRNLFDPENLAPHAAVLDALHAHALLAKDVDYVVADGAIGPVDEFKGRIVHERRWPAGLQTALEIKERVRQKAQGRVMGSITIEHLVGLYPIVCGMTGTAATQARELRQVYELDVAVIPTHRPVIREDHPDVVFPTAAEKEAAVRQEIAETHATGRAVLVGTLSVAESERLSRALHDVPHRVLNARHEAEEAEIIARAGERGAVTISTNMAGRGVDIRLGPGVAELGGLHVIGTNRHDSRRIDHQLRGRAGRQGDPGSSRFFVSREDPIVTRHGEDDPRMSFDQLQRVAEGQNLDMRLFLRKYERVLEGQRQAMHARREDVLTGATPCVSDLERLATLATLDDLWADHLAVVTDLRGDTMWVSLGGRDPMHAYLLQLDALFRDLEERLPEETQARLELAASGGWSPHDRGATWTYLTTDEPFGSMTARVMRGLVRMFRRRA